MLQWEGGYSNHPADRGGETKHGITCAVYMAYRQRQGLSLRSVRHITGVEVQDIYRISYWDSAGCPILPSKLALCHFDWAVNSGTSRAVKTLQQVVGISDDGIIRLLTKQAIIAIAIVPFAKVATAAEELVASRYFCEVG